MWLLYGPLVLLALYVTYNRFFHPLSKVPGPFLASISTLWLVWQCYNQRRPGLDLALHRKYGSVVRISPNEVIFSNPKYFNEVYGAGASRRYGKSRFYEAPAAETQVSGWDKLDMLPEADVEKLRLQKRLVGPVYSAANAKKHEKLLVSTTARWLERLRRLSDAGMPLDFYGEFEILNVDVMTELTFGKPFGSIESGSDGGHMASMEQIWTHWGWTGFLPWLNALERKAAPLRSRVFAETSPSLPVFGFCVGQMGEYQKRSAAGESAVPCVLDDLRKLSKEREEFRDNWATMMALTDLGAGVDTMSWTMAAAMAGICLDEAVYANVRRELADAVREGRIRKGEPVPCAEAEKLQYLQACIHESMRVWPNIAISLGRIVPAEGVELDGYFVPGGSTVGMNSKQLGLSEEIFGPEPRRFRPERWLESSKARKADMETRNLAFGGPSRKCPGKNVAWVCMSINLAALFLNFDVRLLNRLDGPPGPGGRVWIEKGSFPTKWHGMEVELRAR